MSHAVAQARLAAVLLVNVIWIEVPRDAGEQIDIRLAHGLGDLCPKTDRDVIDSLAAQFLGAAIAYHHALPALSPPSTNRVCPVTKRAASDARNRTTSATSSGMPIRLSGVLSIVACTRSGCWSMYSFVSGVSMMPGPTALTVTPRGPHSMARLLTRPDRPAFVAVYAARRSMPWTADTELVITTRPPGFAKSSGAKTWQVRKTP